MQRHNIIDFMSIILLDLICSLYHNQERRLLKAMIRKISYILYLSSFFIFSVFSTEFKEDCTENKSKKIYFYKIQKDPNTSPMYILGSAHCVSPHVLPDIIHETFSMCKNYILECLEPYEDEYFTVHLNYMKNLGYAVNPNILIQRDIQTKNMIFSDKAYEQDYWKEQTEKYSSGWSFLLKNKDKLTKFLTRHNLKLELINSIDPSVFYLGVIRTYHQWKIEKNGMDLYFLNEAKKQGKFFTCLESEIDRIELFYKSSINNHMNIPIETTLEWIDEGLEDIFEEKSEKITSEITEFCRLYTSGDIEKYLNSEVCAVEERNNIWVKKLQNSSGPSFICIGLNHLLGDKGILRLMQEKDYQVTQATFQGF